MRASSVAGIIFANSHDDAIPHLTENRSMASVPFGGRYRLIDFSLSNFVNADITDIGIITKGNYRSLMDHIGSGVHWDLDRKNSGIHILPPFNISGARRYHGYIEALYGAMDFLIRCNCEYIVLTEGGVVANIDLSSAIESHIANNADITAVYRVCDGFVNKTDAMVLSLDRDGRVCSAEFPQSATGSTCVTFGIFIFRRDLLMELVNSAYQNNARNIERDIIADNISSLRIFGYCHKGFVAIMSSDETYTSANMSLLRPEVRRDLFNPQRPVYTKTRDDMATRYGTRAFVRNSFVAEGCVIDGTVRNSILFRGVTVKKGAVVENSILMQGVTAGENVCLNFVVSDKDASISDNMTIKGTSHRSFFIGKNQKL